MVPAPVDVIWDNQQHNDAVTYLVAVRDDDGIVGGTVTGVDHKRLFSDPENGSSLWTLAVDPTIEPARRRRGADPRARRRLPDRAAAPTWTCR